MWDMDLAIICDILSAMEPYSGYPPPLKACVFVSWLMFKGYNVAIAV